jgi:phosphoribosylglycinamide formyltransferase-1
MPKRIAVLASGRGSNLEALYAHFTRRAPAEAQIALVASDKGDAGALAFAQRNGIPAVTLEMGPGHAAALATVLATHRIDIVALAGYLRLVPAEIVRAYRGRVVNVHPALLPAFGGKGMYGERVHQAVLAAGARVTGVTVHFVDEVYDRGATIAQWPVPVFTDDTVHTLAARVLRVEHRLFPHALAAVARGAIRLTDDGRADGAPHRARPDAAFALGTPEDDDLARNIAAAFAR